MTKQRRSPINKTTIPYSADFYITVATVIPVIFLALVLEGGLWAWISGRIKTSDADVITMPAKIFVFILQLFAIAVLLAGTVSEISALHVLLRKHTTANTEDLIYYSTIFLIILLGIALAARVPGIFFVQSGAVSLQLEDEEELRWSGRCARLVPGIIPWIWGKLFLTDKRIVWMTTKELGLLAGSTVEIEIKGGTKLSADTRPFGWTRYLPSNNFTYFPPRGYFFDMTTEGGKRYKLCIQVEQKELEELVQLLIQPSVKPSGLGWPINTDNPYQVLSNNYSWKSRKG